jgi:hypothetical protein
MADEISYFDGAAFLAEIEPDCERYLDRFEKEQRLVLAKLGVPEIAAEKCLNHVERNALLKTYNRQAYLDEKRDALQRWAGHARDFMNPPPENVVRMEAER